MASDHSHRLVTSLPIKTLWTDAGALNAKRVRHFSPDDLQLSSMVQQGAIPIAIADCGEPLRWLERSKYREFWWQEATPHLATMERLSNQDFLGDHCYIASEWSTDGGRPVILFEMHRRVPFVRHDVKADILCKSRTPDSLERIDREFCLGLYRYAVRRYQPIIEERTGVQLGDIQVKPISELHHDVAANVERKARKWLIGFLLRRQFKKQSRSVADRVVGGISPSWYAVYRSQSIYVAFTLGTQAHEDWVVQGTVHELAHRLWEKLGGRFAALGKRSQKLRMAQEGFAVYAERMWFRDSYPPSLVKRLASERLDESHFYIKGLRAVEEVVERHGPDVLLKLPRKWKKLMVLSNSDLRSTF